MGNVLLAWFLLMSQQVRGRFRSSVVANASPFAMSTASIHPRSMGKVWLYWSIAQLTPKNLVIIADFCVKPNLTEGDKTLLSSSFPPTFTG